MGHALWVGEGGLLTERGGIRATYEQAAKARKLIERVATLNNSAHNTITELSLIRGDLLALAQVERDAVVQAVADMGYDPAEIQSILGNWASVLTAMNAEGIGPLAR